MLIKQTLSPLILEMQQQTQNIYTLVKIDFKRFRALILLFQEVFCFAEELFSMAECISAEVL